VLQDPRKLDDVSLTAHTHSRGKNDDPQNGQEMPESLRHISSGETPRPPLESQVRSRRQNLLLMIRDQSMKHKETGAGTTGALAQDVPYGRTEIPR
jgi:hypothetical protein